MRRLIGGTATWVFGISLTVLFASFWGRAVVVDARALGSALAPLGQTVVVGDQVRDWLSNQLVSAGFDPDLTPKAVDRVLADTAVEDALDELVRQVVVASASGGVGGSSLDISGILTPLVPEISATMRASGIPVAETEIAGVVAGLDPLVIRPPRALPTVGPGSPVASRLGIATVLASVVMMLAGTVVVRASPDHMAAARGLLLRIALSGLAFGLMLRVGSWVLDPGGGRAPVSQALSGLARAKWLVPVGVAGVAGAMAGVSRLFRHSIKQVAATPSPGGEPIRQEG